MQAVILAAGKSTRCYPLTLTRPKPLLKIGSKILLEHNLEQLDGIVDEVIIVIGYKGDMIKKKFGDKFNSLSLKYVEQKEQLGTGHALMQVKDLVEDKFIVMMGDDLYNKEDILRCSKYDYAVSAKKVEDPSRFGVFFVEKGLVKELIEKPSVFVSDLANTGLYCFGMNIFDELSGIKESDRKEFEIVDGIQALASKGIVRCITAEKWVPIGYPWDLFKAKEMFGVKGNAIGDDCRIEGEVKDSIVMDNTYIKKGSVVEDSIIGENVMFKGKILSKENVSSVVKGVEVKVNKLGAVIGDNVKAENVIIHAGVKIWPGIELLNKEVEKDEDQG